LAATPVKFVKAEGVLRPLTVKTTPLTAWPLLKVPVCVFVMVMSRPPLTAVNVIVAARGPSLSEPAAVLNVTLAAVSFEMNPVEISVINKVVKSRRFDLFMRPSKKSPAVPTQVATAMVRGVDQSRCRYSNSSAGFFKKFEKKFT
jgi:hypothetical protein